SNSSARVEPTVHQWETEGLMSSARTRRRASKASMAHAPHGGSPHARRMDAPASQPRTPAKLSLDCVAAWLTQPTGPRIAINDISPDGEKGCRQPRVS